MNQSVITKLIHVLGHPSVFMRDWLYDLLRTSKSANAPGLGPNRDSCRMVEWGLRRSVKVWDILGDQASQHRSSRLPSVMETLWEHLFLLRIVMELGNTC
jgi:hypothetical protein